MVNIWSAPMTGIGLHDWLKPIWMHTTSIGHFWLFSQCVLGCGVLFFLSVGYRARTFGGLAVKNFQGTQHCDRCDCGWVLCFVGLSLSLDDGCIFGVLSTVASLFVFGAAFGVLDEGTYLAARMNIQFDLTRRCPVADLAQRGFK